MLRASYTKICSWHCFNPNSKYFTCWDDELDSYNENPKGFPELYNPHWKNTNMDYTAYGAAEK